MVDKKLATWTTENNDTKVLLTDVLKKGRVFIRDKPAIDHLVYNDYRKRKTEPTERLQCPFAMSKKVSLRRQRGFIFPKDTKWAKLFDPM
jgi:glutamate receptor, ionotropic, invertebrate